MRVVWKFPLRNHQDEFATVDMPVGAQILHVHSQDGVICLWAAVDPSRAENALPRFFAIIPSGGVLPEIGSYIGTAHRESGTVWHIFEVIR